MVTSPNSKSLALAFLAGTTAGVMAMQLWQTRKRQRQQRQQQQRQQRQQQQQQCASKHLWKIVEHSFTGAILHVGDQLGLFDLLWELGPVTVTELANHTNWSRRWLQELLSQLAGAGICSLDSNNDDDDHEDDRFSLDPRYAPFLRNPDDSRESIAGMLECLPALLERSHSALVETVRTGRGVTYDFGGCNSAGNNHTLVRGMDRKNRNFFRYKLEEEILSRVKTPQGKSLMNILERGGVRVADVGCGCGASTVAMAQRFPKCQFYAYESSTQCLEVLRQRAVGLPITVCDAAKETLGGTQQGEEEKKFAFVYTHDVVHDMTHPREFFGQVRQALGKDGVWVLFDVKCHERLADNVRAPEAAMHFGFSCLLCLAHATSTPDGAGLGTCGFHTKLCQQWSREAGFAYWDHSIKVPSLPASACYVLG